MDRYGWNAYRHWLRITLTRAYETSAPTLCHCCSCCSGFFFGEKVSPISINITFVLSMFSFPLLFLISNTLRIWFYALYTSYSHTYLNPFQSPLRYGMFNVSESMGQQQKQLSFGVWFLFCTLRILHLKRCLHTQTTKYLHGRCECCGHACYLLAFYEYLLCLKLSIARRKIRRTRIELKCAVFASLLNLISTRSLHTIILALPINIISWFSNNEWSLLSIGAHATHVYYNNTGWLGKQ